MTPALHAPALHAPALHALAPGPFVTLQDGGRLGWRRFGISTAGAMDPRALACANLLVGNPPQTPALEFAHVGGTWEVAAFSARLAVTGGAFALSVEDAPLAAWRSHTLARGQRLAIGGAPDAVWGYLAVAGGFDVAPQLGSCSTHLRSGVGGALLAGSDALALRRLRAPPGRERRMDPPAPDDAPVRLVLGPQDDFFTPAALAGFLGTTWRVSHRADRMGTWLDGPAVAHAGGFNVLSDGMVPGCVQIPGSGQPVVLLRDCQTIGGYPKLGTVVTADLPRFAQLRPGSPVRFAAIDVDAAQALYRRHQASLQALAAEEVVPPRRPSRWLAHLAS